ncbi:MAG: 50S ribosomal protein L4, partial [candidate division NC10 bacterium]
VELPNPKTKTLTTLLADLGLGSKPALLVVGEISQSLALASRNLQWLTLETPPHVSTYQLLRHEQVVFERDALLSLQEALAQ